LKDDVQRILEVLAKHLDDYLEGDDQAFETLADALTAGGFGAEELEAAAMALRVLSGEPAAAAPEIHPAKGALRVPSAEERGVVSPEAWGYLLELRQGGSLDAGEFEQVVDRLMTSGLRPASLELARELAAEIVLDRQGPGGARHGNPQGSH
jgi:uncharacterized protein Smg (DUF494 family)